MIQGVSWEVDDGGRPFTRLLYNGVEALIYHEQNAPQAGVVILEPSETWGNLEPVVIPKDVPIGLSETTVYSATNDPEIVELWWDMHDAIMTHGYNLGKRPITKAVTIIDKQHEVETLPLRKQTTARLQKVIKSAFEQIGTSLTEKSLIPMIDAYRAHPLDELQPIDVWMQSIAPNMGWLAMPDISRELMQVVTDLYRESATAVVRRFLDAAYNGQEILGGIPDIRVEPDQSKLVDFVEDVLDSIDTGTKFYSAQLFANNPRLDAEASLDLLRNEVFYSGNETTADKRIRNISNHINSWLLERCALDIMLTFGATMKVWQLTGPVHGSHCIANAARGAISIDDTYTNDLNEAIQHPPSSPLCDCHIMPTPTDLAKMAEAFRVVKADTDTVADEASIWIDVPRAISVEFSSKNASIEIMHVSSMPVRKLVDTMIYASRMLEPFGVALSGDDGVYLGQDVLWVTDTPSLLHAQDVLRSLLELPTTENYRAYLPLGKAGKTAADFLLDFGGPLLVMGFRLCVRVDGRSECKYYPFIKPI